jgi:hypothetical protein
VMLFRICIHQLRIIFSVIFGKNTNIIRKNTQTQLDVSKEIGLEINTEKT